MKKYQPKPFTEELAEHFKEEMLKPCDDKRTLCNVIKLAFRNARKESHNLPAVRALLVEALWMGQRMHDKLYDDQKQLVNQENIEQNQKEDPFAIDWSNLDGRNVSQGNWD